MTSNNPKITVDFGIASISVEGNENEELEDLYEIYRQEKEELIPDIEKLKRTDYAIQEEYDQLGDQEARRDVSQTFG